MAKILLIDDDEQVLKVTSSFLERMNHEVSTAVDGKQGIRLAENQLFDLIITDVFMPEQDGLNVLMWFMKQTNRQKIIVMSGGSAAMDQNLLLDMCKLLRADKILLKPVDFETLTNAVLEVLR
jgi:DNA-binding response OmpR family regulator